MNKRPLNKAISKHFQEVSLNKRQLHALNEIQGSMEKNSEKRSANRTYWFGFAASLVLFVTTVLVFNQGALFNSVTDKVVAEIAYNHNKKANMEVKTSSIATAGKFLDRLDFSPISSEQLPVNEWTLVGARYCSIKVR